MNTLDEIVCHVARETGVMPQLIRSQVRGSDRASYARHVVCHALSRVGYSKTQIGVLMGRDHSTVIYALRRVSDDQQMSHLSRLAADSVLGEQTQ